MPGTWKSVRIDGVKYNATGDGDATLMGGVFENSGIPHSGGAGRKMARRLDPITGIILHVTALEHDRLKALNDRKFGPPGVPLTAIDNEGNTYRSSGFINYQGMTNQENAATVDLIPMSKEGFILFAA